jgi:hypothetical protein
MCVATLWSVAPGSDDPFVACDEELDRIGAGPDAVSERDSIGINDEEDGWASLGASEARADFYWYGAVEEILTRLRRVPAGSGPEGIRSEFRVDLPASLQAALDTPKGIAARGVGPARSAPLAEPTIVRRRRRA